jgi:hypothetical protein
MSETTFNPIQHTVTIDNGIRQETYEEAARRWKKQYDEAHHHLREAELDIKDLTIRAQAAERERDALKELSLQLAKELVSKCNDPVHRQQVSELQTVDDYWKHRPRTMCTASSSTALMPSGRGL